MYIDTVPKERAEPTMWEISNLIGPVHARVKNIRKNNP